jgi:hypothetical protein
MTDWKDAAGKLGNILKDRFHKIRQDIPTDEIVSAATRSIVFSGVNFTMSTADGPVEIDVNIVKDVIEKINESHKKLIMELANSIGEVVGDTPLGESPDSDRMFAGEDDSSVFLRVEGMFLKIGKETATKILTLGVVP